MSYPEIKQDDFSTDLLRRKEFYSLKMDPERNFRDPPEGHNDTLLGKYLKIHSHQLFVRNFMNPNTPYKRLHLMHSTGCHAAGTRILMFDGTVRNVEEIDIGDKLMGDDGTPRTVLHCLEGFGRMYKVVPEIGKSFICNKDHMLVLKYHNYGSEVDHDGARTIEMTVREFLKQDYEFQRNCRVYHADINFTTQKIDEDPYFYGFSREMHYQSNNEALIPHELFANSRSIRMQLLAGYIDGYGFYCDKKHEFVLNALDELADDIIRLAFSLGFYAYLDTAFGGIRIGGDIANIPTEYQFWTTDILYEKCNILHSEFRLDKLPCGDYHGFELDGNHRYLLGDCTVTGNSGKTLGAISIAQEFIHVYRKMYASAAAKMQASRRNYADLDRITPTVFVLGFGGTKAAFIGELLRHPEFGFISISEKEELIKRQKSADTGLPDDVKHYKEYYSSLKKRITSKSRDGFYKFFGYDEFVNRLFLSEDVKLTDLEALAIQKMRAGESVTLENIIYENIESGKIQVNQQLLAQFENSLIICDEIHNTYNMNMKNNRGVAIQFVLDSTPSVRMLSMSATPINNSPTESVELINYLVPTADKITKKDLFINNRTLQPGGYDRIGKLTRGRISFLQDVNLKYYPRRIFEGEPIVLPVDIEDFKAGSSVPYLKFIHCPMSEFHQNTYNHHLEQVEAGVIAEAAELEEEEKAEVEAPPITKYSYHSIPTDGYSIYNIAFPNPDSDEFGLFRSSEVRNKINMAQQEWRDKKQVYIKKFSTVNYIITGDFLAANNLATYSTKYAKMVAEVIRIIKSAAGNPSKAQKMMIYDDRVKMSGVLLIQEILRANNILDEYAEPVDTTLCCVCGQPMSVHILGTDVAEKGQHQFRPARFIMAHSDIEKLIMEQSLAKFNSPDNAHGLNFMILVGSRIIKESYNFKDIQHLLITSLPINIPTLIQVIGRCVRKGSHINLPPEQREVHINIFISTINEKHKSKDSSMLSPEVYRYIDKLSDYIVIQRIEYEMNRNAIDADIHRDIIMPPELYKEYFQNGQTPVAMLGNLYFDPAYTVGKYKLEELNRSTFITYKYYEEEIKTITMIIKRLFMRRPVWTYDDLWTSVRRPPFGIEVNPALFSENNYIIALNNLVVDVTDIINLSKQKTEVTELMLIEKIFDYNERYIYVDGRRHRIQQVDKFYILFPVTNIPPNPLNVIYAEYIEHIRDKDRAQIRDLSDTHDKVLIDVESYLRPMETRPGAYINIDNFVKESKTDVNYLSKKNKFLAEYQTVLTTDKMYNFLSNYSAQFQMTFLEEAIVWGILGNKAGSSVNETFGYLYKLVIELFKKFGIIIYSDEVRKYKDTAKQYKHGVPMLPGQTPLGYLLSKSIRLFDPQSDKLVGPAENGRWFEISKIAMNKHLSHRENEIIIGYFETAEDYMKFKLRKPVQLIRAEIAKETAARKISKSEMEGSTARTTVGDTRLIERGIVCSTKNKEELLKIMSSLGISISKLERSDIRIKRLCEIIKNRLIDSEIKERQKDSKWKYLYSWWDEMPAVM